MNPKKSEVAQDADWSWATPDVITQIRRMTDAMYYEYPDILDSAEDLFQEVLIYLSVRPEQTTSLGHLIREAKFAARMQMKSAKTQRQRELLIIDQEDDNV